MSTHYDSLEAWQAAVSEGDCFISLTEFHENHAGMMSNDYRSLGNPAPKTAQEIHDTLTNADACIDTETDNFAAIADLAIEGLAARKTISEAVAMLEAFELNDDFHDSLEAIIDVLKREVSP